MKSKEMLKLTKIMLFAICILAMSSVCFASSSAAKPSPDEAIAMLKAGNARFVSGQSQHPNIDAARLIQAGTEDQGDHAYATVITCSDSRVPVELIFDTGVMDTFVIRVAGNVCDTDEVGSIEYGLAHVRTPVLVVLGHTQCGAVTAVTHAIHGTGHALERNIPPLVDNIQPAVKRAMAKHPYIHGDHIIPLAIEENVWQGVEDLYMSSPSTRNLVKSGKVKVVGAIYDVSNGKVYWLDESNSAKILASVQANPAKATNVYAKGTGHNDSHETQHAVKEHAQTSEHESTSEVKSSSVFKDINTWRASRSKTVASAHGSSSQKDIGSVDESAPHSSEHASSAAHGH